jgi:N-glycosylase/DNA lyase
LDIWSIFIEYIKSKNENRLINKDNSFEKYLQILRSLSQELLQRIHNGQTMAKNLEETNDLNDVYIYIYSILFKFISSLF